jgi:hypothetical protein
MRNTATVHTTSKWMRTTISSNEEKDVQGIDLTNKSTPMKSAASTVFKALETLSKFCLEGNGEAISYKNAQRHIER